MKNFIPSALFFCALVNVYGLTVDKSANNSTTSTKVQAGSVDSSHCTCVPYYKCSTYILEPSADLDIRNLNRATCKNYIDVCCDPLELVTPPPPVKWSGCGHQNPEGVEDTQNNSRGFPWMVAILFEKNDERFIYQCGGALIHPQVVLTAAHCVAGKTENLRKFKIRAGDWGITKRAPQNREVKSISLHHKFEPKALHNDIALLILAQPMKMVENVNAICLPPQDMLVNKSKCYGSSWGEDIFDNNGKYQVTLKNNELRIVDRELCQGSFRKTHLGNLFELHKTFICAEDDRRDTCKTDEGSPLICPIPGASQRYFQAGVISWALGCENPGAYTNVALYRNWINDQIVYNNFDMDTYSF